MAISKVSSVEPPSTMTILSISATEEIDSIRVFRCPASFRAGTTQVSVGLDDTKSSRIPVVVGDVLGSVSFRKDWELNFA